MVACIPFLLSDSYGRTALAVIAILLLISIVSFALKPDDSKLYTWIGSKTEGNEKKWVLVIMVISFSVFGFFMYNKMKTPKKDKETFKDIINDVKSSYPENTIGIGDAIEQLREKEKTEKALDIINQLQVEFDKDPLDTTRIKQLESELKALNIEIPFK